MPTLTHSLTHSLTLSLHTPPHPTPPYPTPLPLLPPPLPFLTYFQVLVPKGTDLTLPAFALHKDAQSWGPDVLEFNPDRWAQKRPFKRGSFIPFSDGPRSCVGRHYAMMESVTALAVILSRFEFRLAPGYKWKTVFTGFGLRPINENSGSIGVEVTVHERV